MWENPEDPELWDAADDPSLLVHESDLHHPPSVQHKAAPEKSCLFQGQHCIPTMSG